MFTLTTTFDDSFIWNGKVFNVDMSFDNILRLFEMFDDVLIIEVEKPFLAIKMLIDDFDEKFESLEQGVELFNFLLKEFLKIDADDQDENPVKIFDFTKDAEIIFASFYAEYKIDLFEVSGELHWYKFLALLNNLDDESKFKQIVGIRTMKIPTTDESSQEYRDHIIKMKKIYSLDNRPKEEVIDNVFDDLSAIFKGNTNN